MPINVCTSFEAGRFLGADYLLNRGVSLSRYHTHDRITPDINDTEPAMPILRQIPVLLAEKTG